VIVLLHGNGEDHHIFDPIVPVLTAAGRTVVTVDTRGHGQSARGDGPLTIDRCADDLAAVLDALYAAVRNGGNKPIDQVDVVGFSDGGNIALAFAVAHPGRVRSLVTYGANIVPTGVKPVLLVKTWLRWFRLRAASLLTCGQTRRRLHATAEIVGLMTSQPRIAPASLAAVTAPALIAAGQNDVIRESHTRLIADALPAGRCLIVPDATHGLPLDDPLRFTHVVTDFLDEVSPETAPNPSSPPAKSRPQPRRT
jgi:pimeloyl-ACP methyl ester carboxylesterase